MNKIKLLDNTTINKIAAGEIIERPASVVKELVENSIDAGAKNIVIEIKDAGKSYMRVTDDGTGISNDDINLAFKRHSTSKIESIEDLNETVSLGFRGEALASISAVSNMEVLTRTQDNPRGIQMFLENGNIIEKNTIGCPKGTTMIVKDLFYNTPVRKKFLKSNITETRHISDLVYKLALGNPDIAFKYIKDNKVVINTPGNNNLKSNIYLLLGKDFVDNLKEITYQDDKLKIYGYISDNTFYRGSRNHQYIYVNNRYVKNQYISRFIEDKYKSLIPINKYPIFLLFMEVDPQLVDVNIHPTKQEVKFENQDILNEAIEEVIGSTIKDLSISKVKIRNQSKPHDSHQYENFLDAPKENRAKIIDTTTTKDIFNDVENIERTGKTNTVGKASEVSGNYATYNVSKQKYETQNDEHKKFPPLKDLKIIGIIFKTYIIVEDSANNKVYIIDQHASHERILYEKYKKEYTNERVVTQKLLAPKIIRLTNKEFSVLEQNIEAFYKLGFEINRFGLNSIALRGVPVLFGEPDYEEIFFDILDNFEGDIKSNYDFKIDKIIKIACSKAIKAGDTISKLEVDSLFKDLEKAKNPYTCPHGRPTVIEITKKEFEKQFKRI